MGLQNLLGKTQRAIASLLLPIFFTSSVALATPKPIYHNSGEGPHLELRGLTQPPIDNGSGQIILGNYRGKEAVGIINVDDQERSRLFGARIFPLDLVKGWGDLLEIQPVWMDHRDFETNQEEIGRGVFTTLRYKLGDKGQHLLKVKLGAEEYRAEDHQQDLYGYLRFGLAPDFDMMALTSKVTRDSNIRKPTGGGFIWYFPGNFEIMGTSVDMRDRDLGDLAKDFTLTFGLARHAGYGEERYPSGFLAWRNNDQTDLAIWGVYQGNSQLVREAAVGILEGMFYTVPLITELKPLRQMNDFGVLSNDYETATWILQGGYLNQVIIPGTDVRVGFLESEIYYSPKGFFVRGEVTREELPNFRHMGHDVDWYGEFGFGLKLGAFTPQTNISFGNAQTGTDIRFSLNTFFPLTKKNKKVK